MEFIPKDDKVLNFNSKNRSCPDIASVTDNYEFLSNNERDITSPVVSKSYGSDMNSATLLHPNIIHTFCETGDTYELDTEIITELLVGKCKIINNSLLMINSVNFLGNIPKIVSKFDGKSQYALMKNILVYLSNSLMIYHDYDEIPKLASTVLGYEICEENIFKIMDLDVLKLYAKIRKQIMVFNYFNQYVTILIDPLIINVINCLDKSVEQIVPTISRVCRQKIQWKSVIQYPFYERTVKLMVRSHLITPDKITHDKNATIESYTTHLSKVLYDQILSTFTEAHFPDSKIINNIISSSIEDSFSLSDSSLAQQINSLADIFTDKSFNKVVIFIDEMLIRKSFKTLLKHKLPPKSAGDISLSSRTEVKRKIKKKPNKIKPTKRLGNGDCVGNNITDTMNNNKGCNYHINSIANVRHKRLLKYLKKHQLDKLNLAQNNKHIRKRIESFCANYEIFRHIFTRRSTVNTTRDLPNYINPPIDKPIDKHIIPNANHSNCYRKKRSKYRSMKVRPKFDLKLITKNSCYSTYGKFLTKYFPQYKYLNNRFYNYLFDNDKSYCSNRSSTQSITSINSIATPKRKDNFSSLSEIRC